MIPATNKSKKNDTTSKAHVSEITVPDSIVPPILEEPLSLSVEFTKLKGLVNAFNDKLVQCILRLNDLEAKLNLQ